MVAAFDFCAAGKGGAAPSIDTAMHGLVDGGARRPPAPGRRHRVRDRRRRRGADPRVLRRPGGLGALAAAGVPARPGHRRDQARAPRGDRGDPRRARHHRVGRRPATSARRGRWRSSPPPRSSSTSAGAADRSGRLVSRAAAARRERRARAAALAPVIRGLASTDRPQLGHFTDAAGVLDFVGSERHAGAGRARHLLPGPLPAHQGPADGARPAAGRAARRGRRPAARAARGLPARTTGPTTSATRRPTRRRCAAPTRPSCWCPGSACSASARTSRPPGSRASSTSTRST